MHKDLQYYLLHYSDRFDQDVSKMITRENVSSEKDANRLIEFIDVLYDSSTLDLEKGKFIIDENVDTYAAEEGAVAILGILRANNFNSLADNWM